MTAQVLVTGEYFCDLVFGAVDAAPAAGREVFGDTLDLVPGGTFNIAAGLARAGVRTAWGVEFGTDPFSGMVRTAAVAAGIDPCAFRLLDRPVPRLSAAFSVAGDRGFLSASAEPVRPVAMPGPAPGWVVQTFRFTPDWIGFARRERSRGARLFGDCRDVEATLDTPGVGDLLDCLDVFAPSADEAMRLTGTDTPDAALDRLCRRVPVAIVTLGAGGAIWAGEGGRGHVPSPSVTVADTIGAGDAFDAGYLCAALAGLDLPDRVRAGCLFGAEAVTRTGGGRATDGPAILRFAGACGAAVPPPLEALLGRTASNTDPIASPQIASTKQGD